MMADAGFQRNTPQRRVILEELRKLTSHPSATDLYEIVRRRLPKVSLGTVYRNLELLAKKGIIRKLDVGGAQARFDGCAHRHHHIRCIRCGRVDDVSEVPADVVDDKIDNLCGYKIIDHHLEFIGICPECRNRQTLNTDGIPHQGKDLSR